MAIFWNMYYSVPWHMWRCYSYCPIARKRNLNTGALFVWTLSWGPLDKLLPTLGVLAESPVALPVAPRCRYIDSSRSLVPVHSLSLCLGSIESDCLALTFICIFFPGVYLFLETGSYFVNRLPLNSQKSSCLSPPPKCWDYRQETPCLASISYFTCSSVLFAHHTVCMLGACGDQKRVSDAWNWNYGR